MNTMPGSPFPFSLNCKGKLLQITQPLIMGIINATPDSFFEGHLNMEQDALLLKASAMISDGASILDVGGQSTRPGSIAISAAEEAGRVLPVISLLHRHFPDTPISVDTFHSQVAREAVFAGASIVNDVSGGLLDSEMLNVVANLKVPYIVMHMKGTPQTMQQQAVYEDLYTEILDFFIERINACTKAGINDIILDPGFGFGKTIPQNFQLLHHLDAFNCLNKPLLAGLSRKSSIYKTLGISPDDAMNGSTVLHTIALLNGASLLRVHDVAPAMEAVKLVEAYKKAAS
jgi:dihydropteroate synthase